MFWFDPANPDVEFCDIRRVDNEKIWTSKDGTEERFLTVSPDTICDVRDLPFADNTFWHIVFDPPHLTHIGENAWLRKKYGVIPKDWQAFIRDAFIELFRVLKPNGTLIFKWTEIDIKTTELLKVIPYKPLYGHRSGSTLRAAHETGRSSYGFEIQRKLCEQARAEMLNFGGEKRTRGGRRTNQNGFVGGAA